MSVTDQGADPHDEFPEPLREFIGVKAAARRLGVSARTVRRWLFMGKLRGVQTQDGWTVDMESLEGAEPAEGEVTALREATPTRGQDGRVFVELLARRLEVESALQAQILARAEAEAVLRAELATMTERCTQLEQRLTRHWLVRLVA